jgi:hypothetical protein
MGVLQDRGLTGMEARRYRVIQNVIEKKVTQVEASVELEVTDRQVRRLMKKVVSHGPEGIIHGLVGKSSNHIFDTEKELRILDLWEKKYRPCDLNFTHFTEKLNEIENISVSKEKVRTLLRENEVVNIKPKRGRKHRKERVRRTQFGELLQQDTSPHDWLGIGKVYHAVNVVDDATSRVLFLKLYEHDGTLPNMEAMRDVILKFGLPMSYYVDKAAWFKVTRHWDATVTKQSSTDYETQIERALDELGIELIWANSAPAKGRVERSNGTLQNRLIAELKLHGCKTLEAANSFIENYFIADYARRFGIEPVDPSSAFVSFVGKAQLDRILCQRFKSTVQNDNTISKSQYYKLQLLPTDYRQSWTKAPVEVSLMIDGSVEVRHCNSGKLIPFEILELKYPLEAKHQNVTREIPSQLVERLK